MQPTAGSIIWRPGDGYDIDELANSLRGNGTHQLEIIDVVEATINALSQELRELSLTIHGEYYVCSAF
jgi:hypothetical protein